MLAQPSRHLPGTRVLWKAREITHGKGVVMPYQLFADPDDVVPVMFDSGVARNVSSSELLPLPPTDKPPRKGQDPREPTNRRWLDN